MPVVRPELLAGRKLVHRAADLFAAHLRPHGEVSVPEPVRVLLGHDLAVAQVHNTSPPATTITEPSSGYTRTSGSLRVANQTRRTVESVSFLTWCAPPAPQ